jgi:hypothetical protein
VHTGANGIQLKKNKTVTTSDSKMEGKQADEKGLSATSATNNTNDKKPANADEQKRDEIEIGHYDWHVSQYSWKRDRMLSDCFTIGGYE